MTNWRNRLKDIKYNQDDAAGPVDLKVPDKAAQCLSDWNRWASSGKLCHIFINQQRLSEFEELKGHEDPKFKSVDELVTFLQKHLFQEGTPLEEIEEALSHLHQGGIISATQLAMQGISPTIRLGEAKQRIDLTYRESGLDITEENTYKRYTENHSTVHTWSEQKGYPFYAQTTTKYRWKPNDGIDLISYESTCHSANLKKIFNHPEIRQTILERIMNFIHNLRRLPSQTSETESSSIYSRTPK